MIGFRPNHPPKFMNNLPLILVVAATILIVCSTFTRVPLWIGCFLMGVGVLLIVWK